MVELRARRVAPSAPLVDGEVAIAFDASAGGEIGVLATTEPALALGFRPGPHGNRLPFYRPPRPCPAVLYRYEAPEWHRVELAGLPASYPHVALLPGGELLVACPRHPWTGDHEEPRNAHVFGPDGAHLRAFALGDDIQELVVDDAGTIWTAHGEEGSYADDPTTSLVRWDRHGERVWDSGIACSDTAVNVHGGVAWAYRHRATLVRADAGAPGRHGGSGLDRTVEYESPSPLTVGAIVVTADRLLLAAAGWSWCAVGDEIEVIDSARFADAADREIEDVSVLRTHGSHLYLHDHGEGYHRVDIAG